MTAPRLLPLVGLLALAACSVTEWGPETVECVAADTTDVGDLVVNGAQAADLLRVECRERCAIGRDAPCWRFRASDSTWVQVR